MAWHGMGWHGKWCGIGYWMAWHGMASGSRRRRGRRWGWRWQSVDFPCALHCPAWRLADVIDACHRPHVQEMVSEASCHLFFIRRASIGWSCFGSKGSTMSAMRARGQLRMSGMGAGDLVQTCAYRARPGERSLLQMSLRVFLAFVCLCDICQLRRAGMSCRVNVCL